MTDSIKVNSLFGIKSPPTPTPILRLFLINCYMVKDNFDILPFTSLIQWNLSVKTTSIIKFITCDLSSNVF